MNNLQEELEEMAENFSIILFGAADLSSVRDFVLAQGGEYLASFPRAVSLGMRLLDAMVD